MTYHQIVSRIAPLLRRRRPGIEYWSQVRVCAASLHHLVWEEF